MTIYGLPDDPEGGKLRGDRRSREGWRERAAEWMAGVRIDAAYGRLYVRGTRSVQRIPGAAWNDRRKAYELSLTLDTLRKIKETLGWTSQQMASKCTPTVMGWARAAAAEEKKVRALHERIARGELTELPWEDRAEFRPPEVTHYQPPFEKQRIMATVACELDGCAFLCEMGTGKTRASTEAMAELHRREAIDMFVVVVPARGMTSWARQVRRWTATLTPIVLDGSIKQRAAVIRQAVRNPQVFAGAVFIVNTEALRLLEEPFLELAGAVKLGLNVDESHRIKNPQALVTKTAMAIARSCRWHMIMTGTPITGGAYDIWSQWYVVDLGTEFGANFVQFRRELFQPDSSGFGLEPRDGTVDSINQRIHKRGLRYRKEDFLDLPPKLYEVQQVEMTREQKGAYRQMAEELVAWLRRQDEDDAVSTAAIQLTKMLRLSQITSGHIPDDDGQIHRFTPNPKLDACEELVEEIVQSGRSVIVWSWYNEDVRIIMDRLAHHQPVRIGGTRAQSDAAMDAFQRGDTRLLVANPASGGISVTLTAASHAIFYSQGFGLEHRLQAEDRCHRPGSERHENITYTDLVCTGSIDELVRDVLAAKRELADAIVEIRRHVEGAV